MQITCQMLCEKKRKHFVSISTRFRKTPKKVRKNPDIKILTFYDGQKSYQQFLNLTLIEGFPTIENKKLIILCVMYHLDILYINYRTSAINNTSREMLKSVGLCILNL